MSQDNLKTQFILNSITLTGSVLQELGDITDPVLCPASTENIVLNYSDVKDDKELVNLWIAFAKRARAVYNKKSSSNEANRPTSS
jgi:hypothetical protein